MTIKLTTDKQALVNTNLKWIPITMQEPPRGAKLLLINRAHGTAVLGPYVPGQGWTHWFPLPTFYTYEDDAEVQ